MSNKMWDALLDHAKTCVLSGKLYVYYPDFSRNVGAVFNNIYELNGLISEDQYYTANSLSDDQKVGLMHTPFFFFLKKKTVLFHVSIFVLGAVYEHHCLTALI